MNPLLSLLWRAAPYVAAAALVFGSLYAAYSHGVSVTEASWQTERETLKREAAEANASAERAARELEALRHNKFTEVASNARIEENKAGVDGIGADAAADRLHQSASVLASRASDCPKDSTATQRSKAATGAAMVLSDLLRRADTRAGELAKAYDRARIAGLACESLIDSLREEQAQYRRPAP